MQEHEKWMRQALREAEKAFEKNEVPVGAVVVQNGCIIGKGHNQIESLSDPTAHAEMIALTAAASTLNAKRLENCTLYVTLEPCAMCAGAIVLARVDHCCFGAWDAKAGACGSLRNILKDERLNHQAAVTSGIMEEEAQELLHSFFHILRTKQ